jgi:hypothetical protein
MRPKQLLISLSQRYAASNVGMKRQKTQAGISVRGSVAPNIERSYARN